MTISRLTEWRRLRRLGRIGFGIVFGVFVFGGLVSLCAVGFPTTFRWLLAETFRESRLQPGSVSYRIIMGIVIGIVVADKLWRSNERIYLKGRDEERGDGSDL